MRVVIILSLLLAGCAGRAPTITNCHTDTECHEAAVRAGLDPKDYP